jgi:hypothetical protein
MAAQRWLGTPYRDNMAECGIGACCHRLPLALWREAGWEHGLSPVVAPSRWSGTADRSVLIETARSHSQKLKLLSPGEEIPGDLLGFKVGALVSHIGLMLPGRQFVHALRHCGVAIHSINDPTWADRYAVAWRPQRLNAEA